jgi:hypothetical protein
VGGAVQRAVRGAEWRDTQSEPFCYKMAAGSGPTDGREGTGMPTLRYVVFDNALHGTDFHGWPADEFADALRAPLAAIGVIVDRKRGYATTIGTGELFGAESLSREAYNDKYDEVYRVVRRVLHAKRPQD